MMFSRAFTFINQNFYLENLVMSVASTDNFLRNVTTAPSIFEVTPRNSVAFGDLGDLENVSVAKIRSNNRHPLSRGFLSGNYSYSVVQFVRPEYKSIVVFHQENIDASLMAKKLFVQRNNEVGQAKLNKYEKHFLGPSDWFSSRRRSTNNYETRENKRRKLSWCDLAKDENLVQMLRDKKISHVTTVDSIDSGDLFYFVSDTKWFGPRREDTVVAQCNSASEVGVVDVSYNSSNGVYKLDSEQGNIGIAINPRDAFGNANACGALFKDPSGANFALVLYNFSNHRFLRWRRNHLTFQFEHFLYGDPYRSFFISGEPSENAYYGEDEVVDGNFSYIPDNIFVKILGYLPWRQRVLFRLVNKRWMTVAELAIAVQTKVIDLRNEKFSRISTDSFDWLLPIVRCGLEELTLCTSSAVRLTFDSLSRISTFPKLCKIDLDKLVVDSGPFFSLLDKSPNLKMLSALIPRRSSTIDYFARSYKVKALCLPANACITDTYVMDITNYFPMLVSLTIMGYGFLTPSCLRALMEKYGEQLIKLNIRRSFYQASEVAALLDPVSQFGALTGMERCRHLQYFSLFGTGFASDALLAELVVACPNLVRLDIRLNQAVTSEGLIALAKLQNLKILHICSINEDLSLGVSRIAMEGRLEALLGCALSADCVMTCVRYCRKLKRLDLGLNSTWSITVEDAKQIVRLYGSNGLSSRLTLYSRHSLWQSPAVQQVRNEIRETYHREFIVFNKTAPEQGP